MRDQVRFTSLYQREGTLTCADEATVQDRERLMKEYGVRSIIDLRTKYAPQIWVDVGKLTEAGLSILNKPRKETPKPGLQLWFLNLTMMLLDH